MAALLLSLVGVDRETILADFLLSSQVGQPVSNSAMCELLDEVDRCGGIKAYLRTSGVSGPTQERSRALVLE